MTKDPGKHASATRGKKGRATTARRFRLLRILLGVLVVAVFIMGLSAGAASQQMLGLAGLVAGIQLLPSPARAAAAGLTGLAGLGLAWMLVLALTFVFGRFYCSTLCPLGLFQDGAAWVGRVIKAGRRLIPGRKFRARRKLEAGRDLDSDGRLDPGSIQDAIKEAGSIGLPDAGGDQPTKSGVRHPAGKDWNLQFIGSSAVASEKLENSKGFPLSGQILLAAAGVLGAFFAPAILAWLEPYALAARLGSALFGTAWEFAGEAALRFGIFLPAEPLRFDPAWMAAALVPGLLVLGAAGLRPRLFCRWLCPAGALLRLVAARPVFGFRIKGEVCTSCGACQRVCRTGAADSAGRRIDNGACVECFDCQVVCPVGAVRYGRAYTGYSVGVSRIGATPGGSRKESQAGELHIDADTTNLQSGTTNQQAGEKTADKSPASPVFTRRNFILAGGTGLAAAAFALPAAGLARQPATAALVTLNGKARLWASPPGSGSVERFSRLCLSCGLCARACPSGVLRQGLAWWKSPAILEPYMDFARGFCQFECVACGAVCPSGAIKLLSIDAKTTAAVARSSLDLPKCIVTEKGTPCGACAEHCPTGALDMTRVPAHRHPIPVLDETLCVGCGACETVCPSEPVKALIVSGLAVHETARVLPERPGGAAQALGRAEGKLAGEDQGGRPEAGLGGTEPGAGPGGTGSEQELDFGLEGGEDGFPF